MEETAPSIQEMTGWPGTPSYQRILRAERLIEEMDGEMMDGETIVIIQMVPDPVGNDQAGPGEELPGDLQAKLDARTLCEFREIEEFKQWAYEEAQEILGAGEENVLQKLTTIAARGSGPRFLGMAMAMPPQPGEDRFTYTFTKLLRDPNWVGMDNTWQLCEGLNIHMLGGRNWQGRPAVVLGVPPRWNVQGRETDLKPDALTQTIEQVAAWHGALQTIVHTFPE